ncbi:decarboxylase [Pigmentiphaga sp. NML080357]|jgi:arylmalonate decarboxylase|uniref:maleate cis-trans isomerase family protein n=1 Tax=Pigmentiphaga sp. NML080357 TaxID=2008675 RepID=UPI000B41481C|nr:aspartate/glutamate racemase family protein [Pigmentiphaga sp. NML080357]OVZ55362.1 decarboxylase [Pigmentiphaga sp. NML080357]
MKAVSLYAPYGWKAKIGLIVPSTNTVNEPEFWRMAPTGVGVFAARALLLGHATQESYVAMAQAVGAAAEQLATAEIDIVAYGCTSGSFMCPMSELVSDMQARTGKPALAAAGAVVAALRALGVRRVAVATPYVEFVNRREREFLEEYGFQVTSLQGLGLGETQEERRGIGRVPPEAIYRLARMVDRPEADAVFISCTNLASLGVIAALERDLGKPVITSNQACFWACLRRLGLGDAPQGYGRLLETCVAPVDDSAFEVSSALSAPR